MRPPVRAVPRTGRRGDPLVLRAGLAAQGAQARRAPAPDAEREPETARGGKVLRWPSFVYGVDDEPEQPVAWFTGQLRLSGDFIIVGDIHAPTTDWELAERMLAVAEHHLSTPRQLLIAGDLLNMDAISRFPDRTPPVPLRQELRAANKFILRMLTVFDHVYAFMGNHDVRLQYSLQGDITIRQFARLITDAYESIVFSPTLTCTSHRAGSSGMCRIRRTTGRISSRWQTTSPHASG